MKIGVIATGPMAQTFVDTLKKVKEVELYACSSRSLEKAEAFRERNGFRKAYGSYEELVKDDEVELIYLATPHSHHFQYMKLCIENHKPVLCEKAFTLNAEQAKEIKRLANENKVFVSEAIWPRYMPSRKIINDVIERGIIGTPKILTANLSYVIYMNKRIVDINLAGGALLDVGVYGLTFALMHFGKDIDMDDFDSYQAEQDLKRMGCDELEAEILYAIDKEERDSLMEYYGLNPRDYDFEQ